LFSWQAQKNFHRKGTEGAKKNFFQEKLVNASLSAIASRRGAEADGLAPQSYHGN